MLIKIRMGIEILEVKVGMEMSGAALVMEMLDMLVVMGLARLDMTQLRNRFKIHMGVNR